MIERKIQTEAYWREELEISDQDMEDLGTLVLEVERPLSCSELTRSLIANYGQREEDWIRRQLAKGTVYRPNGSFSVGDGVVFPHLDFAVGTVAGLRDGYNPEYDDFKVIAVQFEGTDGESRQFAAELKMPHKLAFPDDTSWGEQFSVSPGALFDRYGSMAMIKLEERLQTDPGFVEFRGAWLATAMVADIHVGHLNIAEAMLDVHGELLSADELMVELDLPEEIPQAVKAFSLNQAMSQDARFDDVGDKAQVIWSLRRWEPMPVLLLPDRLTFEAVAYDRTGLDVTHLQLEREIDDEASRLMAAPTAADATALTLLLGYPHWRLGTLPVTARASAFFPEGSPEQHTRITFVDQANSVEFPGWVVRAHGFVYGLEEWYRSNNIPVGAYVKLERTKDPHRVAVGFIPRRMQREWVRVVSKNSDGALEFRLQKRPIACEYDEFCLLDEGDRAVTDALWQEEQKRDRSLDELVMLVFLELAKLSPSGLVHAKTLYTAMNVFRRCTPGVVFATLFRLPQFVTTGGGYWLFQERADAV